MAYPTINEIQRAKKRVQNADNIAINVMLNQITQSSARKFDPLVDRLIYLFIYRLIIVF